MRTMIYTCHSSSCSGIGNLGEKYQWEAPEPARWRSPITGREGDPAEIVACPKCGNVSRIGMRPRNEPITNWRAR